MHRHSLKLRPGGKVALIEGLKSAKAQVRLIPAQSIIISFFT